MTAPFLRFAALATAALVVATKVHGFAVVGTSWPSGDITMHLQLGAPASALSDGATNWDDVAESALQEWNSQMGRSRFAALKNSGAAKAQGNRINNVFFSPNVYGEAFGSGVLAVTVSYRTTRNTTESDVVFNGNRTWDSWRGGLRAGSITEFRRVALHEFGHVLGLDHPDQGTPPQIVEAVMNSRVSWNETLQPDDIAGVRSLYGGATSGTTPTIVAHPQSNSVQIGGSYTMSVAATGAGPFSYTWRFRALGSNTTETFLLADGQPSYTIGSVQAADAGTYTVIVANGAGSITSSSATLSVTPLATNSDTLLANISTRGFVGTDADVLIAGIVVGGTTAKTVLVRAVGPALGDFGVTGALADPQLRVVDGAGRVVAENDNWETGNNVTELTSAFTRMGAFQFRGGSRDAALLVTLPPGNFTAQVSGAGGTTGVALVEVYDADPNAPMARTRRLINIATRGHAGTGEDLLIAGLVVSGPGPRTYLIRAVGPTLATSFGLNGANDDPFLQIYRGETLLRENDDWDSPSSAQPALREAAQKVGAFPLQVRRDAAMLITLQPGAYTAKVSGFDGASGVSLVEIYEMP